MSVVKHRCHGLTEIAQIHGAIGWASNIKSCIAQACRASGLMDRLAFPGGGLKVRPLLSASRFTA
jgi:hypothetical protein